MEQFVSNESAMPGARARRPSRPPGGGFGRAYAPGLRASTRPVSRNVAIDIEEVIDRSDLPLVASNFLHVREKERLFGLAHPRFVESFYRHWVVKEAYVKLLGEGIPYGLHKFEVCFIGKRLTLRDEHQPLRLMRRASAVLVQIKAGNRRYLLASVWLGEAPSALVLRGSSRASRLLLAHARCRTVAHTARPGRPIVELVATATAERSGLRTQAPSRPRSGHQKRLRARSLPE